MNCSAPGCPEAATLLVRSDGATADGLMLLVLRSGWEKFGTKQGDPGLFCTEHASHFLSRMPQVALHLGDAAGGDGEVYSHG